MEWIRVVRTQLLDPLEMQSAQISYMIGLIFFGSFVKAKQERSTIYEMNYKTTYKLLKIIIWKWCLITGD